MVWCAHCKRHVRPLRLEEYLCCQNCGNVLQYDDLSTEATFTKDASGQSHLSGNFVNSVKALYDSRERTRNRARMDMNYMVDNMGIGGGDSIVTQALALYTLAVERNFTKGRRVELVEAACLYIACRDNNKPYLLIDFSEYLRVNVYVLGAVFLQLCKLLSLEEHPIVRKPVDPCLFIYRFTEGLLGQANKDVSITALRIIASMKRDWMQTGRKPSGLCGAALYISALSHGLKCSKLDIIKVVHVCEATLMKRLLEFEDTESGSLTVEEFNLKAEELKRSPTRPDDNGSREPQDLICEHKGSGELPFKHGLCRKCYDDFIELSGGLDEGSEPPAFQRAERERMAKEADGNANNSSLGLFPCQNRSNDEQLNESLEKYDIADAIGNGKLQSEASEVIGVKQPAAGEGVADQFEGLDEVNKASVESESLSDIDDAEVEGYLHNEEEKRFKKIIWEEMNREYLEEQAAKEAAAVAAREALEVQFRGRPEELQAALRLAAATEAALAKSRKEKQQKRAADAKNSIPAQTAAEATRQMLNKRRSSKINYAVLDTLFEENETSETPKKAKTESPVGNADDMQNASEVEVEPVDQYRDDDNELVDDYKDDEYTGEDYDGNAMEGYDDDFGDDDY